MNFFSFEKLLYFSRLNLFSSVTQSCKHHVLERTSENRLIKRYTIRKRCKSENRVEKDFIRTARNQATSLSVFIHRSLCRQCRVGTSCENTATLFTIKKRKLCQVWHEANLENRKDLTTGDPYLFALVNWRPPEDVSVKRKVLPPLTVADTPLVMVKEKQSFYEMMLELKKCREVGVDVEHVILPMGEKFTALIQFSTREKDYIIDPIPLWDKLGLLNEVFADTKITKVFHGGGYDLYWLKRDFGVCVINMFDTHEAALVLRYKGTSFASLARHHCNVLIDKTHQNVDWSIRPLPEELLNYARNDAHYLPFLFDVMTNALIEKGTRTTSDILRVYRRTHNMCCKIYGKPTRPANDIRILLGLSRHQEEQKALSFAVVPE